MKVRSLLLIASCLLTLGFAMAQTTQKTAPAKRGAVAAGVDKAMLQKVMDAWVTLDPNNAAKYYDQAPKDVFYDIAPLKYDGWAEYEKGAKALFDTMQSAKGVVNDDVAVHHSGNLAWATATVRLEMTPKSGSPSITDCRWTSIWEHKGDKWLIVHDHFSAPLPQLK